MGKRGKKGGAAGSVGPDPVLSAALAAGGGGGMFRPLPPNKRHDLNKIVEKLLALCSNYAQVTRVVEIIIFIFLLLMLKLFLFQDSPTSPQGLFQEHQSIRALLSQVRALEQCNLNRPLLGSRRAHADALKEWVIKEGGDVDGVEVQDFKEQGLGLRVSKELKTGSPVLSIPRKVLMSADTARDSEIGRLIEKDPMLQVRSA